jgi:hypothetical protein
MSRSKLRTLVGVVAITSIMAGSASLVAAFGGVGGGAGAGGGMGGFGGIGGGAGGGMGGFGGIGGAHIGAGGFSAPSLPNMNSPTYTEHFRELNLAGQVPAIPAKLPSGARIVQLNVNGQMVPMAIDTEMGSGEVQFSPGYALTAELYHAVLTRRVEVVGDSELRDRILEAAGKNEPIEVEGYVFNSSTPYLVLRSVGNGN